MEERAKNIKTINKSKSQLMYESFVSLHPNKMRLIWETTSHKKQKVMEAKDKRVMGL